MQWSSHNGPVSFYTSHFVNVNVRRFCVSSIICHTDCWIHGNIINCIPLQLYLETEKINCLPADYLSLPSEHDGICCIFKEHYIGILYRRTAYIYVYMFFLPDNTSSIVCGHMTCSFQADWQNNQPICLPSVKLLHQLLSLLFMIVCICVRERERQNQGKRGSERKYIVCMVADPWVSV